MCPLMYAYNGTEYLGAAHGLSGILQMLLSISPRFTALHDSDLRASVDYVLLLQTPSGKTGNHMGLMALNSNPVFNFLGNFPATMDEVDYKSRPEAEELVHWCHGAPGVAFLMARAFQVWGDGRYLQSALDCRRCVWRQ